MSSTHDTTTDATNDSPVSDRHASLELDNGDLLIYDSENSASWIQSDTHVSLAESR